MKPIFTFIFGTFLAFPVLCQSNFEVPVNPQFSSQADYDRYEPQVVEAANWLEQTDLNKETDKRTQVNRSLFNGSQAHRQ